MSPTEPFTKELNYEPHGLSSQSDCGRRLSDTNQGGPGLSLQCLVGVTSGLRHQQLQGYLEIKVGCRSSPQLMSVIRCQ